MRLTKIYTRTGDDGQTTLSEGRISKDHPLIEVLGTLDELNCAIGLALSFGIGDEGIRGAFLRVQNELFDVGGELAEPKFKVLSSENVGRLEQEIDGWNAGLTPLEEFLLPRGVPATVACHMARTICRRAERCLVALKGVGGLGNEGILRYVNRLSDWLFVAARVIEKENAGKELLWRHVREKDE